MLATGASARLQRPAFCDLSSLLPARQQRASPLAPRPASSALPRPPQRQQQQLARASSDLASGGDVDLDDKVEEFMKRQAEKESGGGQTICLRNCFAVPTRLWP